MSATTRQHAAGSVKGPSRSEPERRSPAMQQFHRVKEQCPDALVFFRMGDFYELFYEDAVIAAEALGLTLTSRQKAADGRDIPMAGVPHHAASAHLAKLLEKGFRVAICEQMADPAMVKGIVPREVVRVVTPALSLESECSDDRLDSWLAVVDGRGEGLVIAALDVGRSTARLAVAADEVMATAELARLEAREVLVDGVSAGFVVALRNMLARARIGDAPPADETLVERLMGRERAAALEARQRRVLARALAYAQAAFPRADLRVDRLEFGAADGLLQIDEAALRNLEIVRTLAGEKEGALLSALDETRTSMGARLLRRRLLRPLTEVDVIRRRLDDVARLVDDAALRHAIRQELRGVADLERAVSRAELGLATPRELGGVRDALRVASSLASRLVDFDGSVVRGASCLTPPEDRASELLAALESTLEDTLAAAGSQRIVRDGADPRVDELRLAAARFRDRLVEIERSEREKTGIASLRVGYTRVFGFYVEVTRANLKHVPPHFRRKQTVASGERYTTEELEEIERAIERTEARLSAVESEVFADLRARVARNAAVVRAVARWLAELDVAACLAEIAATRGYVRPEVDDSTVLEIEASRHPVVELALPPGEFVPNDVRLDAAGERLWVLTGPNMAGKSTVLRQTALIVILAQMGSYVPAKRARIGVVDRIHTRVGASDNLARGQSTFMVEMAETAAILRGATSRSLVVLDEIGRGTSTYDGLAIARAVAEYLVDTVQCRALFATHYHELCTLEAHRPGKVQNYNVAAREQAGAVVFLRKLVPGGASRSYGVAVARLAGLPSAVVERAEALLLDFERGRVEREAPGVPPVKPLETGGDGWSTVEIESPEERLRRAILDEIASLPLESMTPLAVFERVLAWSRRLRAGGRTAAGVD